MTKKSDIVILGGGSGGYVGALAAAVRGASITLIERGRVGGTCLHRGCIPTKTLLATAHLAMSMSKSEVFAIKHKGFEIDFTALMKRKNDIVSRLEKGILALLKKRKINLVTGNGKVVSPDTVEVESNGKTERITASKGLVIATGSKPAKPPAIPFDGDKIITSGEALSLGKPPASLCIIGAGVIGFEMAELFHAFGAEVTLVEALDGVLPTLDPDIGKEAGRLLKRRKITAHTGATAEKFEVKANHVSVELGNGKVVEAEKVLVVIGRKPNTENVAVESPELLDGSGFVAADAVGKTGIDKLFAAGDVTGQMMLAHFAGAQCTAAVCAALGEEAYLNRNAVPGVVYTKPEIASVGFSEDTAGKAGYKVKSARFDVRALGRAQAEDELIGFVKIVGDEENSNLLGMHIMARGAGELIHEGAIAISKGLTVSDLAETVHAHPGFSESIGEAAHIWMGLPRHGYS